MKIEILGMGCPKCKILYENVQAAVKEVGIDAEVIKVEDMDTIISYGVMLTPALVINGEAKASGEVSSSEEIKKWLKK
ncbi:MAG: TM0996/MTH895 family glutaredoxin-like protein [Candidatus Omnitrophica bacterium]|nr:TM0996/MTH895 family glutaredoxin-like protein [Candidatus Omnitrophota bacterium]